MSSREPISRIVISLGTVQVDISALVEQFPDITVELADPKTADAQLARADAALIGWGSARDVLDKAPRLKWIQTVGAGVEGVVGDGFIDRGILLTNGSGVMASNMAEHVIGMMLAFARCLPTLFAAQQKRAWRDGVGMDTVFELGGQTVVLVGLGDIGLAVAERLQGFGVRVIGVRRSVTSGETLPFVDRIVAIENIDSVLGEADHVVSSVPHTRETIGLFDGARFEAFKDGAYFYNVGRGTSVVQADLIAVLESGKLGGAGLDVTNPEPLPESDPLWTAPNLIITGHTSGSTPHFRRRVLELFGENIRRYRSGEDLINVVDVVRGY